ncbi:MAG: LuxR family maltose regulon positive regulatory protein [Gammaproteobacteria bacterium]|jgi:LuxR family maltose regulon positive regulatory protein
MILDRATLLASERSLDEIKRFSDLIRINVHIKTGELKQAGEAYRQYEFENGPLSATGGKKLIWRELDDYYFTTARLLIARGEGQKALDALEPIVKNAQETGRLLSMTRGQALQSLAFLSFDQQDKAISVLRLAVTAGCSEKYLRVFLDEGEGLIPILQHIIDHERRGSTRTKLGNYCAKLLSAYRKEMRGNQAKISLTPRERQILIGLSHESPSKTIARELGVTESTIKFHLKKIYSKFGVNKRSAAVIEARRQQLL